MKNILVLNYEFPPLGGGASPVSFNLSKELILAGYSVTVVTMGYRNLPARETIDGIEVYRINSFRSKKEICRVHEMLLFLINAQKRIKKIVKQKQYHLIHSHFIIPTGILARWASKKFNIPYVITCHGSDVPGYNPDRFLFAHKFTKPVLKIVCRDAKAVTAPSYYLSNLIKQNIGDYPITVIPNGCEDKQIKGVAKKNIIASAARFLERKGIQYVIQAFDNIHADNWKLYIIGDGPYRGRLERLAKKNKNIIFTGWLNGQSEAYRQIINETKIFALPSANESQGIVYIEAMSAMCAIIATDGSGCRETVSSREGYLIQPDVRGLEEVLKNLMHNKAKLEKFMIAARFRYEKDFMYPEIIQKYIKVFEQ